MMPNIAEQLGHFFEVGFNIGILAYIKDRQIKDHFGNLYLQELQQLKFSKMLKQVVNQVINPLEREMVEKWSTFFFQKGFLCGLNFFGEYIQSLGWHESHRLKNLEILYYQCRFSGDNSIGTYEKSTTQWFRDVLCQLDSLKPGDVERYIAQYIWHNSDIGKKGEFINADCLILLQNRRDYRILCVDLSIFSIQFIEELKNLDYIEIIRYLLIKDINYLRSKSVFSKLCIDTESLDFEFSEDLKSYFTAFKYKDKESTKLIQAAAYAHSFYWFLQEMGILQERTPVVLNVVGYSDRGLSTMSIHRENLNILKACYEIYKHDISDKEIHNARKQVLNRIKRSAYSSFIKGKDFIDNLFTIEPNNTTLITHREQIDNFFNSVGKVPQELMHQLSLAGTMNLRQAHAELIIRDLSSQITYLFLTGNPGIGKTTAIVKFLQEHIEDGFLFFYVSPRKQVNLDIIEKFKDQTTGLLCDPKILAINSHSNLLTDNFGQYTVQYLWNQRQGDFLIKSVNFLDSRNTELRGRRSNRLGRKTEDTIQDIGQKSRGVLNSVCEAISTIIEQDDSRNIIATAAIQSLKKTYLGDTLKYFDKIFRSAYNSRENIIIPAGMRQISSRIKHLFIMIDEITGNDSGVEFLNGISQMVSKYQLTEPQYGFNTKVIVADASLIDKNVIHQHLSHSSPEPDKIYFRRSADIFQPLAREAFSFKNLPSVVINANSYPASQLTITYKILRELYQFTKESNLEHKNHLVKNLQQEILADIKAFLNQPTVEQIIVYIQDKSRLAQLIETLKKQQPKFELFQDYLELHANISEQEKEQIHQHKNNVKVIFMTASGSRGLSFPKVKHILVEVPGFQIEKNLMEIIQVIYRGRGDDKIDNQAKELIFYLSESAGYYQNEPQSQELALRESVLSLLNVLLILKASIMTRIFGSGKIGRDHFIIIPIGEKSISAVGETFSTQMTSLINQLKQEHRRHKSDVRVEQVYKSLEKLLGCAEFVVCNTNEFNYLALQKSFNNQFAQIGNSLDKLLDFGKVELGYVSGGLLVVPMGHNPLEETYLMHVLDIADNANQQLWQSMQEISRSKSYPESLRSAIRDAIELVKKLREAQNKSQKLEQNSLHTDQYYALPLLAFISGEVMREYFASYPQEPEDKYFRDILATYIHSLYSVDSILPIGHNYKDFPFVVFRSYSLAEMRRKIFTDKYLLTSHELNILNLLLSQESSKNQVSQSQS